MPAVAGIPAAACVPAVAGVPTLAGGGPTVACYSRHASNSRYSYVSNSKCPCCNWRPSVADAPTVDGIQDAAFTVAGIQDVAFTFAGIQNVAFIVTGMS